MAERIGEVDGIAVRVTVKAVEPYWVALEIEGALGGSGGGVALLDADALDELIALLREAREGGE